MEKLNITAVSFINTLPFIYGIENSGFLRNYELRLEVPSICAKLAKENIPDIALVPAGAFKELKNYNLLDTYCLGTEKIVKSVLLLSNHPIEDIDTIYLDSHSRTSNELIKILAEKFWKIEVKYKQNEEFLNDNFSAKVSIGDKALNDVRSFIYSYDLAEYWNKLTGLPFVFAVWVHKNKIDNILLRDFNKSLKYGVEKIDDLIGKTNIKEKFPDIDIYTYLHYNLDFNFDAIKHKAFNHYLSSIDK